MEDRSDYGYWFDTALDNYLLEQTGFKTCTLCFCCLPISKFKRRGIADQKKTSWCYECKKIYAAENKDKYREKKNAQARGWRKDLRLQLLSIYSNDPLNPACTCCDEYRTEFLAIDHIHGGGHRQKKEIGTHIYKWLRDSKFPPGFRVLCHNCNQSLGAYGYCPHEKKTENNGFLTA